MRWAAARGIERLASIPWLNRFWIGPPRYGSTMPITSRPTPSEIAKPMPKRLSCGAARVMMPSAATIGSASCSPALKMRPPQRGIS